jgi:hypothetical protein
MSCTHGVLFDEAEAEKVLGSWTPKDPVDFIMGNPKHAEVRARWPRLHGKCPLGCGFEGIAYASSEHYIMGDW